MVRVAHLLPNMAAGGREAIVADLCRFASDHGVQPSIICYDPLVPTQALAHEGVECHGIDRREPNFPDRLLDLLHAQQIDVLHCQGHISSALTWPIMRQIPSVTTIHVALGSGWRWLPDIYRGFHRSRTVTAVSADLASRFRPLSGKQINNIVPGIDLDRFAPARRPENRDIFNLGIAARLHPVKRHRDVIDAMEILAQRGYRCRLQIAGEGPEEQALRTKSANMNVDFLGHVADMPGWLSTLDGFVLASAHEGTPLALLEAMSCGLPCIATAVGGIPDLVGNAAVLVRPRDSASLAAAIAGLIDGKAERERLSLAARQRACDFSVQRSSEQYAAIYRALR